MMQYLMVAAGGALGAMARYSCYRLALRLDWHATFVTLAVNVLGSFLIGLLYVFMVERSSLSPELQALFSVGILGAFTTYSTYSLDALRMLEQGQYLPALGYLLGTLLLCLLFVWFGASLARAV